MVFALLHCGALVQLKPHDGGVVFGSADQSAALCYTPFIRCTRECPECVVTRHLRYSVEGYGNFGLTIYPAGISIPPAWPIARRPVFLLEIHGYPVTLIFWDLQQTRTRLGAVRAAELDIACEGTAQR